MENTVGLQKNADVPEVSHGKMAARWFNRGSAALCLHFAISFFLQIVVMVIIIFSQMFSDRSVMGDAAALTSALTSGKNLLFILLFSMVPANCLAALIGLAFIGKAKGSLRGMFSRISGDKKLILPMIGVTMGFQALTMVFSIIFESVSGSSGMENITMPSLESGQHMNNFLVLLYVVLLGPVSEELIMRGMALKCANYAGGKAAYIFSAFAFAMFHGNIIQGVLAFGLGMFFAWVDVKMNSVIPSVILHIWNNGFAMLMEIFEHKFGEMTETAMFIYAGTVFVIAVPCLILVMKKLSPAGRPETGFYAREAEVPAEEKKNCGLKAVLTSPCFYVFTVLYTVIIITNIIGVPFM